jgi:hypothetical protein
MHKSFLSLFVIVFVSGVAAAAEGASSPPPVAEGAMPCGRVLEAEQGHANATEIYETGPSEPSENDNCKFRSGDEFNPRGGSQEIADS